MYRNNSESGPARPVHSGYRPSGRRAVEIAADVEAAIAAGRAPAGTVLPTVRALADALGVSPGTVASAYRLLAERGAVEGRSRAGTVIRARPGPAPRGSLRVPPGTVDLATGNPDPALLPALGEALVGRVARRLESPLYGGPGVLPALGEWAAAAFVADGIAVDAVTVAGGAMDAIERALAVHLRPGMRVAVEDPAYAGILDLIGAVGLLPEPVAMDDEGMVPDGLRAALGAGAQAVVITPRAQNPTGAALTPRRADELAAVLADAPGTLLVEDDHAGPVSGAGAASAAGPGRPVVVVRSASKALGPDLRVALVGGDAATVAAVEARQAVGAGWVSHLLQALVLDLLTDPGVTAAVDAATGVYAARRHALLAALDALGVGARGRSGFNLWVPVAEEAPVVAGMAARGWAVTGGARFRLASPPAVRVTIAGLAVEQAATVAADLAACVGAMAGTRAG